MNYFIEQFNAGSLVLFATKDCIGKTIRVFQQCGCVPNPLGITHIGLLIKTSGKQIADKVKNGKCIHIQVGMQNDILDYIDEDDETVKCYMLDARAPLVGVMKFEEVLEECEENIYIRNINLPININYEQYLGIPYESHTLDMVFAIHNANRQTVDRHLSEMFCSEFVAIVYYANKLITQLPSNIVPHHFTTYYRADILQSSHGPEIVVKKCFDV